LVEGHLRDKKEAVAWKIKFITDYTVTKHTNITTIYNDSKIESIHKSYLNAKLDGWVQRPSGLIKWRQVKVLLRETTS
jgi:hypothetical protein